MPALPLKPEYGPTLGGMLAPRWHAARRPVRVLVMACAAALVVGILAAVLTLENAHYSQARPIAFHFSYRGLYRRPAPPGAYVEVAHGSDSFTVFPMHLPPFSGSASGVIPLYATRLEAGLARRFADFRLISAVRVKVNNLIGYSVNFRASVAGHAVDGRDLLLLPPRAGARDGVALELVTRASKTITTASPVGSDGVLSLPLGSFSF